MTAAVLLLLATAYLVLLVDRRTSAESHQMAGNVDEIRTWFS